MSEERVVVSQGVMGIAFGSLLGWQLLLYRRGAAMYSDLRAIAEIAGRHADVRSRFGGPLRLQSELSGSYSAEHITGDVRVAGTDGDGVMAVAAAHVGSPPRLGAVEHIPGWTVTKLVVTPASGDREPITVFPVSRTPADDRKQKKIRDTR